MVGRMRREVGGARCGEREQEGAYRRDREAETEAMVVVLIQQRCIRISQNCRRGASGGRSIALKAVRQAGGGAGGLSHTDTNGRRTWGRSLRRMRWTRGRTEQPWRRQRPSASSPRRKRTPVLACNKRRYVVLRPRATAAVTHLQQAQYSEQHTHRTVTERGPTPGWCSRRANVACREGAA